MEKQCPRCNGTNTRIALFCQECNEPMSKHMPCRHPISYFNVETLVCFDCRERDLKEGKIRY